jgi:hypothetical protein
LKYFNQLIIYEVVEMNSTKTIQFEAAAAAAGCGVNHVANGYADQSDSDRESDSESDQLDITKPRQFGKQSARERTQTKTFGYMIDPTRIRHARRSSCSSCLKIIFWSNCFSNNFVDELNSTRA